MKQRKLTAAERKAVIQLCADEQERVAAKLRLYRRYAEAQDHEAAAVGLLRVGMR